MDWLLLGRPNIHCIYFRLIKRVLYTGIGAGVGAAVCYPEEANEALVTVEKEGKNAVEMVQALANGGEKEASENLCLGVTFHLRQSFPLYIYFHRIVKCFLSVSSILIAGYLMCILSKPQMCVFLLELSLIHI